MQKIIAKIIANRLKTGFFPESISQEQLGFLHERQIHNIMGVAQEGIHIIKIKKMSAIVLKLDISQAYDRVSWS